MSQLYKDMPSSLEKKMFGEIFTKTLANEKDSVEASKACAKIALESHIKLLKELQSDTENTNAKFRLKLATMIGKLENQLK